MNETKVFSFHDNPQKPFFNNEELMKKSKFFSFLVLSSAIFSVGCGALRSAAENSSPAEKAELQSASRDEAAVENEFAAQTNLTGTYVYKGFGRSNIFKIQDFGAGKIKVAFFGTGEFEAQAGKMVNTGELAASIIEIRVNRAVFEPADSPGCRLTLTFKGDRLEVEQNEHDCGFPGAVYAGGIYRKTDGKTPRFDEESEADENFEKLSDGARNESAERVRFQKGSSSAQVAGKISGGKPVVYVVGARKGQTLEIKIADGAENNDTVVEIFAPGGESLTGEDYGKNWRGKLPQDGDYRISVGTVESENADFTMRITIR